MPEMAVGIYDWAVVVDHLDKRSWLVGQGRCVDTHARWRELVARFSAPPAERARVPFRITAPLASNLTRDAYAAAFTRVLDYIHAGDCYQINLAQRFAAPAAGDPWLAYQALRIINPAPYAAYLNTPHGPGAVGVARAFPAARSPAGRNQADQGHAPARRPSARRRRTRDRTEGKRKRPRRERHDRRSAAERPVEELRAGFGQGDQALRSREFRHRASSRQHGHRHPAPGPRCARPPARLLSRRLDHRRAQTARDADHRRARAPPARRLLRRHRLYRLATATWI